MLGELLLILCLSVLAGLAWYPCCTPGAECEWCSEDADTVSFTMSGLGDTRCSGCNELNGTYVLTRTVEDPCEWTQGATLVCTEWGDGTFTITATAQVIQSEQIGWIVNLQWRAVYEQSYSPVDYAIYYWNAGNATPYDCTAARSLTYSTHVYDPSGNPNCTSIQSLTCSLN